MQVAGWAAALLVLTGCQQAEDDPEPIVAPTPSVTAPTESTSPTPTETSTPEKESAEDFIRRWAEVEMEMENSGETEEYLALSGDCAACVALADRIEGYYAAGGFVEWGGWKVGVVSEWPQGRMTYEVHVQSRPTRYQVRADGPLQTLDGGPDIKLITLRKGAHGWRVVDKKQTM